MIVGGRDVCDSFLEHEFDRVQSPVDFFFEKGFSQRPVDFLAPEALHRVDLFLRLFSFDVVQDPRDLGVDPLPVVVAELRVLVAHLEAALAVVEDVVHVAQKGCTLDTVHCTVLARK